MLLIFIESHFDASIVLFNYSRTLGALLRIFFIITIGSRGTVYSEETLMETFSEIGNVHIHTCGVSSETASMQ